MGVSNTGKHGIVISVCVDYGKQSIQLANPAALVLQSVVVRVLVVLAS
jgi:hypothetical protein